VEIESPVAVPDALELDDAVVLVVAPAGADPDVVAAVAAVAVGTVDACGWKASTPAVPATVAARTMGDRRMGGGLRCVF
jgi:hypothetical protein